MYYVPDRKIDAYALSYAGNDDKATVFELVFGFAPCNAAEVIRQLYEWIADNPPIKNGEDAHGERFESETMMIGRNGKMASLSAPAINIVIPACYNAGTRDENTVPVG